MGTNVDNLSPYDGVTQIAPAALTASPSDGQDVNLDQYAECEFMVIVGTHTDGTFTVGFEEADATAENGDTADTYTDVDADDLFEVDGNLDTNGELVISDGSFDGSVVKVKYRGTKKFVRATVTVTGSPTTGANLAIFALRGPARHHNTTPVNP